MTAMTPIRLRAAAMLAGLSLMLTGCFITPGKFTSELTILEDDQFTFTYDGEVYLLGLSSWIKAQQERDRAQREFRAYCYGSAEDAAAEAVGEAAEAAAESSFQETSTDEPATVAVPAPPPPVVIETVDDGYSGSRECTPEEEAEQRERWEERQERRRKRDEEQMEQFSKLIGGVDPSDPEAEQKLADVLLRQKGFEKVEVKGDGLFEISYKISGTLSHDYMFPMMEDFPTTNPFVQMFLRDGDKVRINALGFAPQSVSNPLIPLMMAAPGFGGSRNREMEALGDIPDVQGTFTIITTGTVLANNTDEGTQIEGDRQKLTWVIDSKSKGSPTALIGMPR